MDIILYTILLFTQNYVVYCYQQSLYRCITCQDVCVNSRMRQNAYYRNLK